MSYQHRIECEQLRHKLNAALQRAEAAEEKLVPDGWKLVPVEPTKLMLEASYREASVYSPSAYRAMLDAAPTPPQ